MNSITQLKDLNVRDVSFFSKFVTLALLLDSVLNIYGTEALSFSAVVQAVCIIVYFIGFSGKKSISNQLSNVPRWIIWYLLYLIAITAAVELTVPIGYIRVFLWYFVFFNIIDVRFLFKSYQTLAVFIIGFFYLQELTYLITGTRILGFIPGLPIRVLAADNDVEGYLSGVATTTRSISIFSEPAHLAQWLFPLLCIRLFSDKYRNIRRALLIAITLLLTRSGNAMFGLVAVGTYYIFQILSGTSSFSNKIKMLAIVSVGVIGIVVFLNSSAGKEVIDRRDSLSVQNEMDKGYATSSFMRIFRGYFVYGDYSTTEKIFGNPSESSFWAHANKSGISSLFKEHDTYLNTVHRILIYTGLIGAFLIILLVISLWRDNSPTARAILVVWVVFSFISSGFFTGYTSIYLLFIYLIKKRNIGITQIRLSLQS